MITNVLSQILDWFEAEDKELLRASWQAIFDLMLTPYQELLEREMNTSVNTIVPLNKRFYENYQMEYVTTEHTISSLPYLLPVGFTNVRAFGSPEWTKEDVTLPVDLGEYATDITTSDEVTVDGTKLLGTGSATVEYKTTYKGMATIEDGYIVGPVGVTSALVDAPAVSPVNCEGYAEVLAGGRLYDPTTNFRSLRVGSKIKVLSGYYDTITKIVDDHTIETTPNLPLMTTWVGKTVTYDIEEAFPYTMDTDAVSIPQIGDYREGIDYVIKDGVLAFANDPGTGLLVAYISFLENPQLSDRFGKPVGYSLGDEDILEYHKKLVALWHSIFDVSDKKRMEFLLSAFMGIPYVGPWDGDITIEEIQYDYTVLNPSIDFTFGNNYNTLDVVTTQSDYFFSSDKVMLLDGGRFLRITEVVSAREAKVEGSVPNGTTVKGQTGSFTFDRLVYRNSKGAQVILDVPPSAVPIYKPGETVATWSKLFTGIRVRDRVDRHDYVVDDATKFYESGAVSDLAAVKRMLVANTFLLEVDYESVDLSRLSKVKAAWTQYQELGRSDFQALALDDRLVLETVYGYIFTSSYTHTSYLGPPITMNENNCWVNQAQPRMFDGTVTDGSTPGLNFDGTIDVTVPSANKYNVTRNYTIMARVKFDAVTVDQWIFTRDSQFRFGINAASPGELQLQVYDSGAWTSYTSTGAGLVWNQWYVVACVVRDTDVTFHVDSTFSDALATTFVAPAVSTSDLYIGTDHVTWLTADVDYVHMWAAPLSQSDIDSFILSGLLPHQEYQMGTFQLNSGSGTTAVDDSTLTGFDKTGFSAISWPSNDSQWHAPRAVTMAARFMITNSGEGLVFVSSGVSAGDADWEIRIDDRGTGWKLYFFSAGAYYASTDIITAKALNQWCSVIVSIDEKNARMKIKHDHDSTYEVDDYLSGTIADNRTQNGGVATIGSTVTASALTSASANAIIRDVTVWAAAFTNTEMEDWLDGTDQREWDQILNIPCNEVSGTAAADIADDYMVVI